MCYSTMWHSFAGYFDADMVVEEELDSDKQYIFCQVCCYVVVTLLLHCCYIVVTLLLRCCYVVVTLLLRCCYIVVTLLLTSNSSLMVYVSCYLVCSFL